MEGADWLKWLALVVVAEALAPLLFTRAWREALTRLLAWSDGQVRFVAAVAMAVALGCLAWLSV